MLKDKFLLFNFTNIVKNQNNKIHYIHILESGFVDVYDGWVPTRSVLELLEYGKGWEFWEPAIVLSNSCKNSINKTNHIILELFFE